MNHRTAPHAPLKIASLTLLLALVGCAKAGGPAAPKGRVDVDGVFARAHTATLGEREPPAHMEVSWVVSAPSAGMSFPAVQRSEAPGNQLMSAEVPGVGRLLDGYINGVAFEINPIQGARIKSADETSEAAFDADPRPYLRAAERYPTRRLAGTADHAGVPCHVVEAVNARGRSERLYFGVADGLPRGSDREVLSAMGPLHMTAELYDYQELCPNVLMPTRIIMRTGPMVEELRATGCALPEAAPPLRLPPEVEALQSAPPVMGQGHDHGHGHDH